VRQAERRNIWVGMAKETAHQLGTPLSSLMGWTELLQHRVEEATGPEIRLSVAELSETVSELRRDIDRLGRVAERFSNIGSEPKLERLDPCEVVGDAVSYMRRRLPQKDPGSVDLRERYDACPHVRINAELLHWSLENLITNAVSALEGKPGTVEVSVGPSSDRKAVDIQVRDTGRGMSTREQRRAFDPGYTTKRRGWGLGLALSRRVVEDYHGGRIWIRRSATGQGSTLAIRLPAAD
jgi:signal transduction histidine kinase